MEPSALTLKDYSVRLIIPDVPWMPINDLSLVNVHRMLEQLTSMILVIIWIDPKSLVRETR